MNRESMKQRRDWAKKHYTARTSLVFELLRKVRNGKDLIGVEIGVWKGDSILYLLGEGSPIKKIYGIDPFDVFVVEGKLVKGWGRAQWDDIYRRVEKKLSVFRDRVELIRERSEVCCRVPSLLDFVGVDGDQSYQQVLNDIAIYEKKIVRSGLIYGQNYFGRYTGGVRGSS